MPISDTSKNVSYRLLNSKRFQIFLLALLLRLIICVFFGADDMPVFLETGRDILVNKTSIYAEDSLHDKFNYPPLAYLAILPGQALYYALPIRTDVLLRILYRLPMIFADIWLAHLLREKSTVSLQSMEHQTNNNPISKIELFILFNPLLIYVGSIKGHFDIIPVLFFVYSWIYYKKQNYILAGVFGGLAILSKQYSVLFSFFIGINLMKLDLRKLFRYIWGHLIAAIPVIAIAGYLNFDGMIYHAIVFHLDRGPAGMSFTSIIHHILFYEVSSIADLFVFVTTVLLIIIQLYLAYKLWISDNASVDVIKAILYSVIFFFILNKVFWPQYLAVLAIVWVLYRKESGKPITRTQLGWSYVGIPICFSFKAYLTVPSDIQSLLGNYWFQIVWLFGILLHFIILIILHKLEFTLFPSKKIKIVYALLLPIAPIHYYYTSIGAPYWLTVI